MSVMSCAKTVGMCSLSVSHVTCLKLLGAQWKWKWQSCHLLKTVGVCSVNMSYAKSCWGFMCCCDQ